MKLFAFAIKLVLACAVVAAPTACSHLTTPMTCGKGCQDV